MKKGLALGITAAIGISFFSGCGDRLPAMTYEQEKIVVEYAAQALLHHMKNYESRLVDLSLYDTEPAKPEDSDAGKMDPTADTDTTDVSEDPQAPSADTQPTLTLGELLMPEGAEITFVGYRITDHYPEGDTPVFALDAEEGKKLLVMSFEVANRTDAEMAVDLLSQEVVGEVELNGTEKTKVLSTLLMDDLLTFIGDVEAGGSRELVLIAEVNADVTDFGGARLLLYKGSDVAVVSLQ